MDRRSIQIARIAAAAACSLILVVASAPAETAEPSRGAALLAPFKRDLQKALKQGLAEGPAEAIEACRMEAPSIAARLSKDGVRVGRASHKLRNPANVAPAWVAPILARYLEHPDERAPQEIALGDDRAGRVEPILLQPLCLTCHGAELAPDVRARIDALYPDDQATGFEVGDLRGVFWVEYPVSASPDP
jgi:hypothetical protein